MYDQFVKSRPTDKSKYVSPLYCRAEMYAGHIACCHVSHGKYADETDRWMDARPLHYDFR